jgi:hypothetical protein
MKKNKTLIIILIIVAVLVIGAIVFILVRRRNKAKREELEAQLAALQAQQNNPSLPPGQKAGIGQQIAALLAQLSEIKANTNVISDDDTIAPKLYWNGGGVGICANTAKLSLDKKLKRGTISAEVCQLQSMLNKKGSNLVVDGNFGKKTEDALLANAQVKEITLDSIPRTFYA